MDRLRRAMSKKRSCPSDGGPSRRRSSPPPPPPSSDLGNIPPFAPISPIPYPFDEELRMDDDMKARDRKFRNFLVLTPIFPDIGFLRDDLMILDDVREYFVARDLDFVFGEDPGVYDKVVREFACSFEPEWGVEEKDEARYAVVREWKFQLGGRRFRLGDSDLRTAFGFERHDGYMPVPKSLKDKFWRMITKSDRDYKAPEKATDIQLPVWKFIHRFIATCILLRKDEGRWVNSDDLDIMCCMYENLDFDPLYYISKSLKESDSRQFKGKYLNGGHFVTMLARFVGFILDPSQELPKRVLGENELVSRGFVKRMNVRGVSMFFVIGLDKSPAEDSHPAEQARHDDAGPSSADTRTLDDVWRRLDDMALWHGDMMRGLYTHLGCPGYRSPPGPGFARTAPRTSHSPEHVPMDMDFGNTGGVDPSRVDEGRDADDDDSDSEINSNDFLIHYRTKRRD